MCALARDFYTEIFKVLSFTQRSRWILALHKPCESRFRFVAFKTLRPPALSLQRPGGPQSRSVVMMYTA